MPPTPSSSISEDVARAGAEALYPGAHFTAFSVRLTLEDDAVERAFAVEVGGQSAVIGLTGLAATLLRGDQQAAAFAALQALSSALGWPDGWCHEVTVEERRTLISPRPDRLVRTTIIDVRIAQLMTELLAVVDVITARR